MDGYEAKKKFSQMKGVLKGYSDIKMKVKEATNLDPWGPTTQQLEEICDATRSHEDRKIIVHNLFKRIRMSSTKEWQHIHKSLAVFEYLMVHGDPSIVDNIKREYYQLKTLHDFSILEDGKDKGEPIREKSKKIVEWVQDPSLLEEERDKKNELRNRYTSIQSGRGRAKPAAPKPTVGYTSGHPGAGGRGAARGTTRASTTSQATPAAGGAGPDVITSLEADQEFIEEQRQIERSIQASKKETEAPATESSDSLFTNADPFAAPATSAAPAVGKNNTDNKVAAEALFGESSLFDGPAQPPAKPAPQPQAPAAPAAPAPAPPAPAKSAPDFDDIFGTPAPAAPAKPPASQVDDLFGAPAASQAPQPSVDDLFGAPAAAPAAKAPAQAPAKKDPFDMDRLCDLDNLTGAGKPKAAPAGQSLNELRAKQEFENQLSGNVAQTQAATAGNPGASSSAAGILDLFSAPSQAPPMMGGPMGGGMMGGAGGFPPNPPASNPPQGGAADFNPFA